MKSFIFVFILVVVTALVVACQPGGRGPSVNCLTQGSHSYFVATFDNDTIGSLPAPSTPLQYGPPGASLEVQQAAPDTIRVVDSIALGSKALWITRPFQPRTNDANIVRAVLGTIDGVPNDAGVYYINFEVHGEVIPQYLIAGMAIAVLSENGHAALSLKLYDGAYHLWDGSSYTQLSGTYDLGMAHSIHIELNLDTGKFSICVNDEVVVSNKAFLDANFANLHSLQFFAPAIITEAFEMVFVVDDIRITK